MPLTYMEMVCLMEFNQDPSDGQLMGTGEQTRAMKVARAGMNLREDEDDTTFWQDFMNLCGDAEGMADLLGVKPAEVRMWAAKIRDTIEEVRKLDSINPEGEDDSKVMPTGDNDGALSVDDQGFAGN